MEDKNCFHAILPGHTNPTQRARKGDRIAVYWQDDNKFYAGKVAKVLRNGKVAIHYDDGDKEDLWLDDEVWEYDTNDDIYPRRPDLQHPNHQPHQNDPDQDHAVQSVQPHDAQVTHPILTPGMQTRRSVGKPEAPNALSYKTNRKTPAEMCTDDKKSKNGLLSLHTTKVQTSPTESKKICSEATISPEKIENPLAPASASNQGSPPVSASPVGEPASPIGSGVPFPRGAQHVSDALNVGISKKGVEGNRQEHFGSVLGQTERCQEDTFGEALAPLLESQSSQLNNHNRLLSNLTSTVSQINGNMGEIHKSVKTLRADVNAIESGAVSRQEVRALLDEQEAQYQAHCNREFDQGIAEMKAMLSDVVKTEVSNMHKTLSDQVEQTKRMVFNTIMTGIRRSARSKVDADDGNGTGGI